MRQLLPRVEDRQRKKWGVRPSAQKLTIFDFAIFSVDMNPKKPKSRKSKSAGISLEPDLIKRSKEFAEKNGFGSLSNWVRFLLTQELSRADGNVSYKLTETPGKTSPQPHFGGNSTNIVQPSAGGFSTAKTSRYQRTGRGKSST